LNKDRSSGMRVFFPDLNLRIFHSRLSAETSIFTAEVWTILLAINAIVDFNCTKAVIFLDFKSVSDVLASPLSNNKNYLIHRIKNNLLDAIRIDREINLFWLHIGAFQEMK